jgi:hypothetical protein
VKTIVKVAALTGAALLALTGCGPDEGDIVDKQYREDLSYWTSGPVQHCSTTYSGSGKYRTSRTSCYTRTESRYHYDPAQYWFMLRTEDGKVHRKDVSDDVWYRWSIGDHFKKGAR